MEQLNDNFKAFKRPSTLQLPKDDAIDKKIQLRSTLGSIAGVSAGFIISTIAFSKNKQPVKDIFIKNDIQKSIKNIFNATKVDYEGIKGFGAMTLQAAGAALGSLFASLTVDKNENNKKAKIKEALFMINNVAVPTAFVKSGEFLLEKIGENAKSANLRKFAGNKFTNSIMIALGLVFGMMTSISVTNTINSKFIDKNNQNKKKMRPIDFIYHVDDIIPILVCSKTGIFSKLPLDRTLPFIYGFMGREVGQEKAQK